MRKSFYEKLDEISEDVISMGSLVQEAVHNAIKAFVEFDVETAQKVIDEDIKIDEYDIMIEEKCIVVQAEHQPVASDLRFLHSVSLIIKYLERIGDLSVNLARIVKRLAKYKEIDQEIGIDKELTTLITEMGSLVKSILGKALEAFKNRDPKLASKLDRVDNPVDDIQKMIFKKLYVTHGKEGYQEEYVKFITNISLASRYLERIGD
ncbi:MAG: phosphate signaling complex protein PhoU, partial [Actinobacteria bacterium]|nr:phosphate signaling complex protein PhoU [Actinomycetota bacterium]